MLPPRNSTAGNTKVGLALFVAAIVFFVVISPATPTPIAVVSAHGKAPAPSLVLFALLLLPFVFKVDRSFAYLSQVESCDELPHAHLVDLTCTRLC